MLARVELPRIDNRSLLQYFVGNFCDHEPWFELPDLREFITSRTVASSRINLGLKSPPTQRFRTDTRLGVDRITPGIHGRVVIKTVQEHPDGPIFLILRILLRH